jgi:hypothetical protein
VDDGLDLDRRHGCGLAVDRHVAVRALSPNDRRRTCPTS